MSAGLAMGYHLSKSQYRKAFYGPLNKNLGAIFNLSETELENFIKLKHKIFADFYNADRVKLFPEATSLLESISRQGELWILSTAPEIHIKKILKANQLQNFFTKIIGHSKKQKSYFLEKAVTSPNIDRVFFVTDTVGDLLEASRVPSVVTIAVTWGFHTPKVLANAQPSVTANKFQDVLKFIQSNDK